MRPSNPLAMTPVGAKGDNAPALAPQHTQTVIRNALIPRLPATTMATGASSAVVAILPAPKPANPAAKHKKNTGIIPTRPRARQTRNFAILSSDPLTFAHQDNRVTPTKLSHRLRA